MQQRFTLNEQQQLIHDQAVYWFYNSPDQVFQIAGAAGTGKSVLIGEILRTLDLQQESIMAMTFTGAASLVMRRNGFPDATTIHSSMYYLEEYIPFPHFYLLFFHQIVFRLFPGQF